MSRNFFRPDGDQYFQRFLALVALCVPVLVLMVALYLLRSSQPILNKEGISFFWQNNWDPVKEGFGALSFLYGTLVTSFFALLVAAPLSIGVALFLTECKLPKALSSWIQFFVEILAAIPSVVYGLWGIFVLAPYLRLGPQSFLSKYLGHWWIFSGPPYGIGLMSASLILALMILPSMVAMMVEVFKTVVVAQKESALALGATRYEMIKIAVLSTTRKGIFAAGILGLGRALGETMAVTMLIGNRNEISFSLLAPAQTMASVIANEYAEAGSDIHLSALSATGLLLMLMTLVVSEISRKILKRTLSTDNKKSKKVHLQSVFGMPSDIDKLSLDKTYGAEGKNLAPAKIAKPGLKMKEQITEQKVLAKTERQGNEH